VTHLRARSLGAIALGLALTLALGAYLRWFLAGVGVDLPSFTRFEHLRHAHSHLGYYAVLVPLAWLGWARQGVMALQPREAWLYGAGTALATAGFVQAGYGLLGIVGSTLVGALWMLAAWRAARAARGSDDPLQLVLCGTVAALACIPVIAIALRRDPTLAAAAVQSFLALMLFLVVAPSALVALGLRQRGAWGLGVAGLGAGAALGLWEHPVTRVALAVLAAYWLDAARRMPTAPLRAAWGAAAVGLLALASGLLPAVRDVAVGAVHFLVLGPLLMSLAAPSVAAAAPEKWWWVYLVAVGTLAGPLVWRALGVASPGTAVASAIGGTAVLLWWVVLLVQWASGFTRRPPAART
jgi:hypothetical protein